MKKRISFYKLFSKALVLGLGSGFCLAGSADICPMTSDIIASDPNVEGLITYLAPGWHSEPVSAVDLTKSDFYWVYADQYTTSCVYDTPSGYLVLYPNNSLRIPIDSIVDSNLWYCVPAKSPYGFTVRLMDICVCRESRTYCNFYLQ